MTPFCNTNVHMCTLTPFPPFPIGEKSGVNLYEFALNQSVNLFDLLGLDISLPDTMQKNKNAPVLKLTASTREQIMALYKMKKKEVDGSGINSTYATSMGFYDVKNKDVWAWAHTLIIDKNDFDPESVLWHEVTCGVYGENGYVDGSMLGVAYDTQTFSVIVELLDAMNRHSQAELYEYFKFHIEEHTTSTTSLHPKLRELLKLVELCKCGETGKDEKNKKVDKELVEVINDSAPLYLGMKLGLTVVYEAECDEKYELKSKFAVGHYEK